MARSVNVPLSIDDFQKVSDRVPLLSDFKPSGKYVMEDLHSVGGLPAVMKMLLAGGALRGDCLTVTGKTVGREPEGSAGSRSRAEIVHPLSKPIKPVGPHPDSARQSCAGGRGCQNHGQGGIAILRSGARL